MVNLDLNEPWLAKTALMVMHEHGPRPTNPLLEDTNPLFSSLEVKSVEIVLPPRWRKLTHYDLLDHVRPGLKLLAQAVQDFDQFMMMPMWSDMPARCRVTDYAIKLSVTVMVDMDTQGRETARFSVCGMGGALDAFRLASFGPQL